SDNANYSHLTWKEIATLASNPNYEIGNHTYNMHKLKPRFGVTRMKGESVDTYLTTVGADISRMQQCLKTKSNVDCYIFAYPFGALDKDCKKMLISMGFKTMLNCTEGVNKIERGNMETLYSLKRYNRDGKYSTSTLLNKIAQGEKKLKERELKAS
ncbi:MAG: polysaccharide deacetylase family protein, partial [Clostridia bacterium]